MAGVRLSVSLDRKVPIYLMGETVSLEVRYGRDAIMLIWMTSGRAKSCGKPFSEVFWFPDHAVNSLQITLENDSRALETIGWCSVQLTSDRFLSLSHSLSIHRREDTL